MAYMLLCCYDVHMQAFGDAVMDEAPLLIISNYEVTYFLLRDVEDVTNKVLKVSPPVPWDCKDPPAMACWLYALKLAAELWNGGVKETLRRDDVPITPHAAYQLATGGATLQLHSRFLHGVSILGPRHAASAERRQQQQQCQLHPLGELPARSNPEIAGCGSGSSSSRGSSDTGSYSSAYPVAPSSSLSSSSSADEYDWQAWAAAAQQPGLAAAVSTINVLPFLSPSLLKYTDDSISCSSTSIVVKVRCCVLAGVIWHAGLFNLNVH